MPTRRRAREIVVQLLYEDDLNPEQDQAVAEQFLHGRLHGNKPLISFAHHLWREVIKQRWELDKSLSELAQNWSLRRMAAIDRNVLRLAAFEILHTDTPGRVVINEAVELAKRYGNEHSGQFVNGILDRLLHQSASPPVAETTGAETSESPTESSEDPQQESAVNATGGGD